MRQEKVTFESCGYRLVGIVEYPGDFPAPGVILFHGLTNSKDDCPLIREISRALVENGFVSFRFDFFGSGESPGELKDKTWKVLEQNARDALRFFSDVLGVERVGVWGRSSGGTVAILCTDLPAIKATVLASTPVLLEEVFINRFESIRRLEKELEAKGRRLPGTGNYKGPYAFNEEFFAEIPAIEQRVLVHLERMERVLVLATTPDTKVPLNNATTIINKVKEPKSIHIFEGVDHDYKGVENHAVRMIVSWFKTHLLLGGTNAGD